MRRWLTFSLLLISATTTVQAQPLSGWEHYKDVTGNGSAIVGGTHTDIVLPIHLSADSDIRNGMKIDGSDIRITDTSNNPVPFELVANGHVITPDGIWSGYSGPNAVYSPTYDKTWVASHGASGYGKIVEIDHATNAITAVGSLGNSTVPSKDDHNNAGLVLTSTGKVLALYAGHTDTTLRYRISATAGSCASMVKVSDGTAGENTIDPVPTASQYSYSVGVRLSAEGTIGRIYWFYRYDEGGPSYWGYITSDNDGVTWSAHTALWETNSTGVPYMTINDNGVNRIDFIGTDNHPGEGNRYIAHFYYDGSFKNTDGTALAGTAPFRYVDTNQLVFNGTDFGGAGVHARAWMWSTPVYDGTRPHVLFTVYPNTDTDHRYYYGRWDGSSWDTTDITGSNTGTGLYEVQGYYSGGLCFNRQNVSEIYLSQRVSGIFEIQRWTTTDNGATWSKVEDITSGSAAHNFRPFYVNDRVYFPGNGEYVSYTNYHTPLRCHPPLDHYGAYAYVKVPTALALSDIPLRAHWGNAGATTASDPATVWGEYTTVAHGLVQPKQINSNIASKGTFNVQDLVVGEVWTGAPGPWGQRINLEYTTTNGASLGIVNMASWPAVELSAWWRSDTGVTGQQYFANNFTGTDASLILRKTGSATTYDAFVRLESNLQVPASGARSGINIPDDTPFFAGMYGRQSSGWSHLVQQNTSESSAATNATTNGFDVTASSLALTIGAPNPGAGTGTLRGAFSEFLLSNVWRSKAWRDTQYAFADGETNWTFGELDGGSLLSSPTLIFDSKTASTVTLSWADATGGTPPYTYDIQARAPPEAEWTTVATDVTSPHTVTGLTLGTYEFRLRVTDSE